MNNANYYKDVLVANEERDLLSFERDNIDLFNNIEKQISDACTNLKNYCLCYIDNSDNIFFNKVIKVLQYYKFNTFIDMNVTQNGKVLVQLSW